jgi:divalent metal cation (Fe/Co/Zn/Cd) transporter
VLGATAVAQLVVYVASGSVAPLADLIHNFGDAATAIPLTTRCPAGGRRPRPRQPGARGPARTRGHAYVRLAVIASALAVGAGAQVADPLIGRAITLVISKITLDSWRTVRGSAR